MDNGSTLLEVRNLATHFFTEEGVVRAVDGVDFSVCEGEIYGLVGESGCGKTVTALSLLGLIDWPGKIVQGQVHFAGLSLLELKEADRKALQGSKIAMIFQEPHLRLNPVFSVGSQIAEVLQVHKGFDRKQAWDEAVNLLKLVGISEASNRVNAYPHEISGGQAQRVMIAMAIAINPQLLLADEPTTALDVTIQAQILNLIQALNQRWDTAVILITHDLGVIAEMAARVGVMYAGSIVEEADVGPLFRQPRHPYTQGLLKSMPIMGQVKGRLASIPGSVPDPLNFPIGCRFAPRCEARVAYDLEICSQRLPDLLPVRPGHRVRCWLYQSKDDHEAVLEA
jgi:oligopeptide/dipeptide ABC transporter ATP-binding protein